MPQLHFYVNEQIARSIRERADAAGLSVSKYLAEVVQRDLEPHWPEGFFETVAGGWQGEPLSRHEQGQFETRDALAVENG